MRKIILYTAVSLDGFIASKDHSLDWLEDPKYHIDGEDFGFSTITERCDTSIAGNKTLEVVMKLTDEDPFPLERSVVFTRTPNRSFRDIEFVTNDIIDFCTSLKSEEGKDIWLVGGSQINGLMLDAGLIDEIQLTVIPTVLSEGVPLFDGNKTRHDLNLIESRSYKNGFVKLKYTK